MRVAILGAGIQGSCVALALAERGVEVHLYDRATTCLSGASRYNEGKIHLGFVYAADPTLRTARLMVQGSLAFCQILRRWIGSELDRIPKSRPFYYLVHRSSQLAPTEIQAFFGRVHQMHQSACASGLQDYFGTRLCNPPEALNVEAAGFDEKAVEAVFKTNEIAIDPEYFANVIDRRLHADPLISFMLGVTVRRVERDDKFCVHFEDRCGKSSAKYDQVVNALWDGRLQIDATMGINPAKPWLFRYKEYLYLRHGAAHSLPSATVVLGPFGDLVGYANGSAYLSWYPAGRRIATPSLVPPSFAQVLSTRDANQVKLDILAGLGAVAPAVRPLVDPVLADAELRGGWIYASGETDIDDPSSGLHERYAVGPWSSDGYHTIDTGKFCLAPLFAMQVADRIAPQS